MPQAIRGIPSGYELVNFAGRIYAVYATKLPNGQTVQTAWRIDPKEYETFGIVPGKIKHLTKGQFQNVQVFGDIGEIVRTGKKDEHPLQTYLKQLREVYGSKVSWLNDREYMQVFLMGWMEGWDPGVLQQRLKRTSWYQTHTAAQRSWEMDTNKADRKSRIESRVTFLTEALQDLYGPSISLQEVGIKGSQILKWAKAIEAGEYGNPEDGFNIWLEEQRAKAEKHEGSTAWMDRERELEEQRAFLNRPEDMFEQLREEATYWLGPGGVPSTETLKKWAADLVSEKSSEADWATFLREQTKRLYPWLGSDTPWQEFADPYKRMAEELWGRPVDWNDPVLAQLGGTDPNGAPTGASLTFQDFNLLLRSSDEFWNSPTANEEGWGLFNLLQETFTGVPS